MTKIGKKYEILSLSNDRIKTINSLSQRKYRKELKLFVAEGIRVCKEALNNGWSFKYFLFDKSNVDNSLINDLINEVMSQGGDIIGVTSDILKKISHKDNPQNVLGVIEQKWNSLPLNLNEGTFVALECIRDPGNLGTILRTMDAVGAKGCILLGECTDPFSYESVRASMGAIFNVNIIGVTLEDFIKWKFQNEVSLIGTSLNNADDYTKTNWKSPFILAMGNEQQGLSEKLLSCCNQIIRMPMLGSSDSLNLAVSTGVALYESIRKNPK
ncbi:RNA methyltransferase [Alphaproteobacteria bacterium]|nr:RNA methyltransferase [Alphaproteobacteria bacterium]